MTRAEEAQRLVDEGRVNIVMRWSRAFEAEVQGDTGLLSTWLYDKGYYDCDCAWGRAHAYTTDLCAHALAVRLAVEKEKSDAEDKIDKAENEIGRIPDGGA